VPVRVFFTNSLMKEAHCCLEQSGKVDTYPELLGKGEGEAEGWGKRGFPGSTYEGLLVITLVQVDPAQGQYWRTGSKR
jgi:hypothetical protein